METDSIPTMWKLSKLKFYGGIEGQRGGRWEGEEKERGKEKRRRGEGERRKQEG